MKLNVNSELCPEGAFTFCAITGKGIENENNGDYYYKSTIEVDEKIASPFLDAVDEFMEDEAPNKSECVKIPYQTHDDYEGIPVGKVWIYAHTSTTFIKKKTQEEEDKIINIYDKDGNKCTLPEGIGVGSGSIGKMMGSIELYTAGTSRKPEHGFTFWLNSIQIKDFVEYAFKEEVEQMDGGSFSGFGNTDLEKDEKEPPRRKRRERTEKDEEEPPRRTRREQKETSRSSRGRR